MRKRISRLTAGTLPWYLRLYGVMIGSTIPGHHHQGGSLGGIPREERFNAWAVAGFAFLAITGNQALYDVGAASSSFASMSMRSSRPCCWPCSGRTTRPARSPKAVLRPQFSRFSFMGG